jgi:hypothetical protein
MESVARISGDEPVVILPNDVEISQHRRGTPNIREIRRVIQRYTSASTQALVVENMAIDPALQNIVTLRLVRPTLNVITGVGPDHLESLPGDLSDQSQCLLQSMASKVPLILSSGQPHTVLQRTAKQLGFQAFTADQFNDASLHPYMQSLAGAAQEVVTRVIGRELKEVEESIRQKANDLQRLRVVQRGSCVWVDGFSVNDPISAQEFSKLAVDKVRGHGIESIVYLFNHRSDRPSRLPLFASLLETIDSFLIGDPVPIVWHKRIPLPYIGRKPMSIVKNLESTLANKGQSTAILCLGNAGGTGIKLRQWLTEHGDTHLW